MFFSFFLVKMFTGHLKLSRIIYEFQCIAAIISQQYQAYKMKNPDKTGGNG